MAVAERRPARPRGAAREPADAGRLEGQHALRGSGRGDQQRGGSYLFAGRTNQGLLRRGLVAFDVARAIPPGSTIDGVTLALRMSRTRAGTEDVSLHRVTSDWGEGTSDAAGQEGTGAPATAGDATWIHTFYPTSSWTGEGGDYSATASATAAVAGAGVYTWSSPQLAADVQAWLDGAEPDHGWILIGGEVTNQSAKRFNSRTNLTDPPALTIDFTPPPPVPSVSRVGLAIAALMLALAAARALGIRRRAA